MALAHTKQYAQTVCQFLAEGLRTRTVTPKRAAEIADKVLGHLNLLDTESHFLSLVKELSRDFEELHSLEERIKRGQVISERRDLEQAIRDYAIAHLAAGSPEALEILRAAGQPEMSQAGIFALFPDFREYYLKHHGN